MSMMKGGTLSILINEVKKRELTQYTLKMSYKW